MRGFSGKCSYWNFMNNIGSFVFAAISCLLIVTDEDSGAYNCIFILIGCRSFLKCAAGCDNAEGAGQSGKKK